MNIDSNVSSDSKATISSLLTGARHVHAGNADALNPDTGAFRAVLSSLGPSGVSSMLTDEEG
jgi:hypothetical protein